MPMRADLPYGPSRSTGLVDLLDRVLDKGLLIAGDIKVSLAEVELLTIRIRLIICSIDKAQEIGLDWWKHDPHFAPGRRIAAAENEALRRQVRMLERRLAAGPPSSSVPAARRRRTRAQARPS
jgi:gas vesicle protein GvpA/GvpJ/GvpM family